MYYKTVTYLLYNNRTDVTELTYHLQPFASRVLYSSWKGRFRPISPPCFAQLQTIHLTTRVKLSM